MYSYHKVSDKERADKKPAIFKDENVFDFTRPDFIEISPEDIAKIISESDSVLGSWQEELAEYVSFIKEEMRQYENFLTHWQRVLAPHVPAKKEDEKKDDAGTKPKKKDIIEQQLDDIAEKVGNIKQTLEIIKGSEKELAPEHKAVAERMEEIGQKIKDIRKKKGELGGKIVNLTLVRDHWQDVLGTYKAPQLAEDVTKKDGREVRTFSGLATLRVDLPRNPFYVHDIHFKLADYTSNESTLTKEETEDFLAEAKVTAQEKEAINHSYVQAVLGGPTINALNITSLIAPDTPVFVMQGLSPRGVIYRKDGGLFIEGTFTLSYKIVSTSVGSDNLPIPGQCFHEHELTTAGRILRRTGVSNQFIRRLVCNDRTLFESVENFRAGLAEAKVEDAVFFAKRQLRLALTAIDRIVDGENFGPADSQVRNSIKKRIRNTLAGRKKYPLDAIVIDHFDYIKRKVAKLPEEIRGKARLQLAPVWSNFVSSMLNYDKKHRCLTTAQRDNIAVVNLRAAALISHRFAALILKDAKPRVFKSDPKLLESIFAEYKTNFEVCQILAKRERDFNLIRSGKLKAEDNRRLSSLRDRKSDAYQQALKYYLLNPNISDEQKQANFEIANKLIKWNHFTILEKAQLFALNPNSSQLQTMFAAPGRVRRWFDGVLSHPMGRWLNVFFDKSCERQFKEALDGETTSGETSLPASSNLALQRIIPSLLSTLQEHAKGNLLNFLIDTLVPRRTPKEAKELLTSELRNIFETAIGNNFLNISIGAPSSYRLERNADKDGNKTAAEFVGSINQKTVQKLFELSKDKSIDVQNAIMSLIWPTIKGNKPLLSGIEPFLNKLSPWCKLVQESLKKCEAKLLPAAAAPLLASSDDSSRGPLGDSRETSGDSSREPSRDPSPTASRGTSPGSSPRSKVLESRRPSIDAEIESIQRIADKLRSHAETLRAAAAAKLTNKPDPISSLAFKSIEKDIADIWIQIGKLSVKHDARLDSQLAKIGALPDLLLLLPAKSLLEFYFKREASCTEFEELLQKALYSALSRDSSPAGRFNSISTALESIDMIQISSDPQLKKAISAHVYLCHLINSDRVIDLNFLENIVALINLYPTDKLKDNRANDVNTKFAQSVAQYILRIKSLNKALYDDILSDKQLVAYLERNFPIIPNQDLVRKIQVDLDARETFRPDINAMITTIKESISYDSRTVITFVNNTVENVRTEILKDKFIVTSIMNALSSPEAQSHRDTIILLNYEPFKNAYKNIIAEDKMALLAMLKFNYFTRHGKVYLGMPYEGAYVDITKSDYHAMLREAIIFSESWIENNGTRNDLQIRVLLANFKEAQPVLYEGLKKYDISKFVPEGAEKRDEDREAIRLVPIEEEHPGAAAAERPAESVARLVAVP